MRYEIVVVVPQNKPSTISAVTEFNRIFSRQKHVQRLHDAYPNRLVVFVVESKNIKPEKIYEFEQYLASNDYTKLYATTYEEFNEVDARFFTIDFDDRYFADMRALLIEKLQKALGRKLMIHENIYYCYLTKKQARSGKVSRKLDNYMSNPAVDIIICL